MKTYLTIIFSIIFPIKIHHFSHDNPPHLGPLGRPDVEVGTISYAKCGNVPTDISVMHMCIYIYICLYINCIHKYIYIYVLHVYVLWVADICRPLTMGFPGTPGFHSGLPPAKSRAPQRARKPPPQSQWHQGQYTNLNETGWLSRSGKPKKKRYSLIMTIDGY